MRQGEMEGWVGKERREKVESSMGVRASMAHWRLWKVMEASEVDTKKEWEGSAREREKVEEERGSQAEVEPVH